MAPPIVTRLTANTSQFEGQLNKAGQKVRTFSTTSQGQFNGIGASISKLGGLLGAAFIGRAMVRSISNVAQLGDELAKMSARTGLTVETLNGLTQAANLSDVSTQQLTIGLFQLNKNLLDTTRGTGEAKTSFEAMGIGAEEAAALLKDPEKAFLTIADRLANISDPSRRAAEAMRIFGKSGAQLLPLLNQGSEAIARQIKEMQRLRPITAEQAAQAEKYNDALTNLSSASQGLAQQGFGELLPVLTKVTDTMTGLLSLNYSDAFSGLIPQLDTLQSKLREVGDEVREARDDIGSFVFQNLTQGSRDSFQDFVETLAGVKFKEGGGAQTPTTAAPTNVLPGSSAPIESTTKKNRFALKIPVSSPADPLGVVKAIKELREATERGLGEAELENAKRFRELARNAPGTLAARASESTFQAERFPDNAGVQLVALQDQVNLRRNNLELLGRIAKEDRGIIRLEDQRLAILKDLSEEQTKSAQEEADATEKLRVKNAELERLRGPQIARRDAAVRALRVDERGRPTRAPGGELLDQLAIARADLKAAETGFATTGDKRELDKIQIFEEQVRSLGIAFDNVGINQMIEGFEAFTGALNTTITTMVQGVLLGTQDISALWRRLMSNLAAQLIGDGSTRFISQIGTVAVGAIAAWAGSGNTGPGDILAAQARGAANPALFGPGFASGGSFMVNGLGGVDQNLVRFRATRGERVTIETPEQMRAREGGSRTNVTIINNTGQRAESKETKGADGSINIEVMVGSMLAKDIGRRGPLSQALEAQFGLKRQGVR